ncbi:MAG: SBBP repeat-containing protein [Bacteroidia bacterium]
MIAVATNVVEIATKIIYYQHRQLFKLSQGNGQDFAKSCTTDSNGNIYLAGVSDT